MGFHEKLKKVFSLLLCLCLVLQYVPAPANAQGICDHHTCSREECGYVAAAEGADCSHECSEACRTLRQTICIHNHETEGCIFTPAVEAVDCDHVHTECSEESCDHVHGDCAYVEAQPESWSCGHVCDLDNGCVTLTCVHVCAREECGYVAAVEGQPCGYQCADCAAEAAEGICAHDNSVESCPECVAEIQDLLDALPDMEDITDENRADVISWLEAIDSRKWKLSDEARSQLDTGKYEDAAFVVSTPENYFGFAVTKRYEAGAAETPVASFAFLDDSGAAATVITAEGASVASVSPVPNGGEIRGYLPVGTYTLEESVEGQWNLSLAVNGQAEEDLTFTGESGRAYMLETVNTWGGNNSGTCGETLEWILEDGVLTISGEGAMYDYDLQNGLVPPWLERNLYSAINQVMIADGATSIGHYAFAMCQNLASVSIPETVTSIGVGSFGMCTNLVGVNIPGSVSTIGLIAFIQSGLTEITVPEGVTIIGDQAFYGCTNLARAVIPASVTTVGGGLFSGCANLQELEYGAANIPDNMFAGCSSLISADLTGVESIGSNAFAGCTALATVTLGEGLGEIKAGTFANCPSLKELSIPGTVTSIASAFSGSGLETLTFEEGTEELALSENAFSGLGLTELALPGRVKTLGSGVLAGLNKLTTLTFEEGILEFRGGAFGGSPVAELVLPASAALVEKNAFGGFTELTSITIQSGETVIQENAFTGFDPAGLTVYAPCNWEDTNGCFTGAALIQPHSVDPSTGICGGCQKAYEASFTVKGKTNYSTLKEALAAVKTAVAADQAVVTLLQDLDLGESSASVHGGIVTLDLNGYTLKASGYPLHISGDAQVTLEATTGGMIQPTASNGCAVFMDEESVLTVNGGTLKGIYAVNMYVDSGTVLVVNGGRLEGTDCAIEANGSAVTVNGGELVSRQENIYYAADSADFSNHPDPSGITLYVAVSRAVSAAEYKLPEGYCFLTWSLEGTVGKVPEETLVYDQSYIISKIPAAVVSVTIDNVTADYHSLQDALDAVETAEAEDRAVVTVLQDVVLENDPLHITGGIFTLNLQNHSITAEQDSALVLLNSADVTLEAGETGMIRVAAERASAVILEDASVLTVNGGTLKGTAAVSALDESYLMVNGGTLEGADSVIEAGGSYVAVNGGVLKSEDIHIVHNAGTVSFAEHGDPSGILVHVRPDTAGETVAAASYELPEAFGFVRWVRNAPAGELTEVLQKEWHYVIVRKTDVDVEDNSGTASKPEPEPEPEPAPPETPSVMQPNAESASEPETEPRRAAGNGSALVLLSGEEKGVYITAQIAGGMATVQSVDSARLNSVIGDQIRTGTVVLDFSRFQTSQPITRLSVPSGLVKAIAEAAAAEHNDTEALKFLLSGGASVEFDAVALMNKSSQTLGSSLTLALEPFGAVSKNLTQAQRDAVGSRQAFDITLKSGGKTISDLGGKVKIRVPYTLAEGQKAEGLLVRYVDEAGALQDCETSYDAKSRQLCWTTDHFSLYMIDYVEPVEETAEPVAEAAPASAEPGQPSSASAIPAVTRTETGSSNHFLLWISAACLTAAAILAVFLAALLRKQGKYQR